MATRKRKSTPKPAPEPAPERAPERASQVKAAEFVPVWQQSQTALEVSEHFGHDDGLWASSFSSRLRKMGVNLKKMKRRGGGRGKSLNVDELNELADESFEEND